MCYNLNYVWKETLTRHQGTSNLSTSLGGVTLVQNLWRRWAQDPNPLIHSFHGDVGYYTGFVD